MSKSLQNLLDKARHFCDYQERYTEEVKRKLIGLKADETYIETILRKLEEENLLSEDRYARAFAKGKLRSNRWGKNKIRLALQLKGLNPAHIQQAFYELDEEEYMKILSQVIESKQVKAPNETLRNAKIAHYAIQKGFESRLVWEMLNRKK